MAQNRDFNYKQALAGPLIRERKRVAELEAKLAEALSSQNKESSELQCQIARLLNQLEQEEAEKRDLESHLIFSQQETHRIINMKEMEWTNLHASLQSNLKTLSWQCEQWRTTLESVQQARAKERVENNQILSVKEEELALKSAQLDELQGITVELTNEKSKVAELDKRVHVVEEELTRREQIIQQKVKELVFASLREKLLQQQLQDALEKVESLESALSEERSLLKELQSSHDLSQHQVKELTEDLEREKSSHQERVSVMKELEKKVDNLKIRVKVEAKKNANLKGQLKSCSTKCCSLLKQCQEMQQSKSDLSVLQTSFDTMKKELSDVSQKLSVKEEDNLSCLRKMDSLITEFQSKIFKHADKDASDQDSSSSTPDSAGLQDKLRLVLISFESAYEDVNSELHETQSELETSKVGLKQLTSDCVTYKEAASRESAAFIEAEEKLRASSKELAWQRKQLSTLQAKVSDMEKEFTSCVNQEDLAKSQLKKARVELDSLNKRLKSENDVHCQFLLTLQEQLNDIIGNSNSCESSVATNKLTDYSWAKQSTLFKVNVMTFFKQAREKMMLFKSLMKKQKDLLEYAADMQEETLNELNIGDGEKERQWQQRLVEIKNYYEFLLIENERGITVLEAQLNKRICELEELKHELEESNKVLKLQLEEIEESNSVLKLQLVHLKDTHSVYKNDRACLLSCVCLMVGSLFPALSKIKQLTFQKYLLCHRKNLLVNSLHTFPTCLPSVKMYKGIQVNGILHFRIIVITVLAVNRLIQLKKESTLFLNIPSINGGQYKIPCLSIHLGCKIKNEKYFIHYKRNQDIALWLRSEQILLDVRKHMSKLQSILDLYSSEHAEHRMSLSLDTEDSEIIDDDIKTVVIKCHSNFLKKMSGNFYFPQLERIDHHSSMANNSSLWSNLRQGLRAAKGTVNEHYAR